MKSGFTLLELVIGLLLSSMIAIVLYTSFFSINRSVQSVENLIDQDLRITLMHNQLERDISGIFVPFAGKLSEQMQKTEKELKATDTTAIPIKPIDNVFMSQNQQQSLSLLTFITNNPMRIYEYAQNATVKPFVARVVYKLVPERGTPSFTLIRQESNELDLVTFEKAGVIRSYELISHIKQIKTEFSYSLVEKPKEQPKTPAKEKQKEEKPKPEYITVSEWVEKSKADKKRPLVPQFITFDIRFWNNDYSRETPLVLRYEIPTYQWILADVPQQQEPMKKEEEAKKKEEADKKKDENKGK